MDELKNTTAYVLHIEIYFATILFWENEFQSNVYVLAVAFFNSTIHKV